ncbi:MAG: HD-GYP domain-containing protein [Sulfurimonas sp.]|jgi:HD-GYP domain-containing protein (c-di-GMP phosphodiesterase class II)|uniref:HD-GYP domain-containing protein n=1 Tax=Sulfurimonas sp. TaxID=2022749 RepID=UPI00261998D1|nr:HD-GYP domain-containing protein [Sulfurimonas sp.]MDD3475328.1 HD-GYP domain-containing protein [Sulfurimonas sp.]
MSSKYISIDKNIIKEGLYYDFDIFFSLESKTDIKCCISKGFVIACENKTELQNAELIFVVDSEYIEYKKYYKTYLNSIVKSKNVSFEAESKILYKNASEKLLEFFDNPEDITNYDCIKKIVGDIVGTVADEKFRVKSLMSEATSEYYVHTHSLNVAIYSLCLGTCIGLGKDELHELGESAMLHDIGKIKIDSNIIDKNTKLTKKEFEEVKKHALFGYEMAKKIGIKNENILAGIIYHHEKIDGSGYPCGLKEEDIPLYARIISICSIFNAITSKRTYRDAMLTFDALKLMKLQMKDYLDSKLINKFIEIFK